jgi:hypothetical protein
MGPNGYPSDPSERARQLVEEGRIGGPRPGAGRPRKPRATELIAQAAIEHADELIAALVAGIAPDQPADERSRAADRWGRLILQEGALQQRERAEDRADAYSAMTDDEVRREFASVVVAALRSGEVDAAAVLAELPPTVDADVVDA